MPSIKLEARKGNPLMGRNGIIKNGMRNTRLSAHEKERGEICSPFLISAGGRLAGSPELLPTSMGPAAI